MDFWQQILSAGEGALESIGEGIGQFSDAFIDYKAQELAERNATVEVAKQSEPVKGTAVSGQPIVVGQQPTTTFDFLGDQRLMVGVGLLILILIVIKVAK